MLWRCLSNVEDGLVESIIIVAFVVDVFSNVCCNYTIIIIIIVAVVAIVTKVESGDFILKLKPNHNSYHVKHDEQLF